MMQECALFIVAAMCADTMPGCAGYLGGGLLDELPILRSPASGFEQEQSLSPRKRLKPEEEEEEEETDAPEQRGR